MWTMCHTWDSFRHLLIRHTCWQSALKKLSPRHVVVCFMPDSAAVVFWTDFLVSAPPEPDLISGLLLSVPCRDFWTCNRILDITQKSENDKMLLSAKPQACSVNVRKLAGPT